MNSIDLIFLIFKMFCNKPKKLESIRWEIDVDANAQEHTSFE